MSNVPTYGPWARLTGSKGDRATPTTPFGAPQLAIITLASPFVRYDTTWTNPTVYKTWDGLCWMEGLIRRSDSAAFAPPVTLATLPVQFRPNYRVLLNGVCSADGTNLFARVDILPDGTVSFQAASASPGWISMTGRWYRGW